MYRDNGQEKNVDYTFLSLRSLRLLVGVEGSGVTQEYIDNLINTYQVDNDYVLLPNNSNNGEDRERSIEVKKLVKKLDLPENFIPTLKKLTAKQYHKAKKKLFDISCDYSLDEYSRHEKISQYLQGIQTNRKVTQPYQTYKRLEVLAYINEHPYCDFKSLCGECVLSDARLRIAVNCMVDQQYVCIHKSGRRHLYVITSEGLTHLLAITISFLNESISSNEQKTHYKNAILHKNKLTPLKIVRKAMNLSKQLKNLGIYPPRVQEIIEKKEITSLETYTEDVIQNKSIRNAGAFIFCEIIRGIPLSAKLKGAAENMLKSVANEVKGIYKKLCLDYELHKREYVHFANCLAKAQRTLESKGKTLKIHDVNRIFGWLIKRWGGTNIEDSKRYNTKTYEGRNKLFVEVIKPRMEISKSEVITT